MKFCIEVTNSQFVKIFIIKLSTKIFFVELLQSPYNINMGKSCKLVVDQFIACLKKDECVTLKKKTPKECIMDGSMSDSCRKLHNAYILCRKDQLDMTRRIRGPKSY